MDQMVDRGSVKRLRRERSWSQDQLASVSGLSLRTVQRIETEGGCSLDSKKALAVAFEINASDLNVNYVAIGAMASNNRGRKFGFTGALLGLVSAYVGIGISYNAGHITASEAGTYFGAVGAFCGICCATIGVLSRTYKVSTA